MNCKVLWIDDEYELQKDFIGAAEQEGIDIIPFASHEEGMTRLGLDPDYFHAVILDAKVKNKKDDIVTGLEGLTASRDKLIEMNANGYNLEYFIFTGQPGYMSSDMFRQSFGNYYTKVNDNEKLFIDVKKAVANKVEYQIQNKYKNAFEVCNEKYIGEGAAKHLMDILKSVENPGNKFDDEKYFNGLRKVIEIVFRASNKLGLLHDKCIPNGIVNLTWSSLFMATKELELKPSAEKIGCSKIHFPSVLARNIKSILDITSAASHTEEERETGKLNFAQYKKHISSNYLLYSLTFQVMDILLWYKTYADENPDIEKNKSLWITTEVITKEGDWIRGEIIRIAENGYGTFQPLLGGKSLSILPAKIKEHRLCSQQLIEVTTKSDTSGTKTFIENIRLI